MVTLQQKIRHIWDNFNQGKTLLPPSFPYDLRHSGYRLPPNPDSLCETCWNGPFGAHAAWLFNVMDASDGPKTYFYFDTWADIESRAKSGCAGCSFLTFHQLESQGTVRADISITVGLSDDKDIKLPSGMHVLAVNPDVAEDRPRWISYAYALNNEHPSTPHTNMHVPILDVGSTRAFAVACGLLRKCETEHERCRNIATPPEETRLPKRLIDCTRPTRPRLVECSEDERGRYVALSYVWGRDQPHKTTRSNLRKYGRRIALRHLPQTIRDAIRVAHGLGFERLWVDSLCIVQDADDEKQHEIGRMHHIYRYASLTIAAARARHAGEGFLCKIQPSPTKLGGRVWSVPILCAPTRSSAAPKLGTVTIYSQDTLPENSPYRQPEPVDERGWCFQEKLMSPRSLIFTSSSLLFRCQTAAQPVGFSYYDQDPQPRLPDAFLLQTPSLPLAQYNPELIGKSWQMIVGEYTRRSTTEPSDRLVACAAIAEAFHHLLGDSESDYLAGLWRRSLLTDLLWRACDKNGRNRRPTQYRAPSWSWAAMDGRVNMMSELAERRDVTPIAEVVRCTMSLKNNSLPFGEVSGGSLVLRTQLLQLELTGRVDRIFHLQFNPRRQLFQHPRSDDGLGEESAVVGRSNAWYTVSWWAHCDDSDSVDDEQACIPSWAIPFIIHGVLWLEGLIVARVHQDGADSPDSKTLYRRIGCFRTLWCDYYTVRPFESKEAPVQEIEII